MKHIVFFIYIFSFMMGSATVLLSVFAYIRYRSRLVKYYILFLLSFMAVLLERTVYFYMAASSTKGSLIDTALWIVSCLGCGLLMVSMPFLVHELMELPMPQQVRNIFRAAAILPAAGLALYYILPYKLTILTLTSTVIFLCVLYGIVRAILNYKNIKDPGVRKVTKVFLTMLVLFFPYLLIDTRILQLEALREALPYGILSIPVFYIAWNAVSIYFGIKYFDRYIDAMSTEQKIQNAKDAQFGVSYEAFYEKYGITGREKEVIELLAKGQSYAGIGESLFISVSTARSHIYNIYQKTGAKNKVELINLMRGTVQGYHTKVSD